MGLVTFLGLDVVTTSSPSNLDLDFTTRSTVRSLSGKYMFEGNKQIQDDRNVAGQCRVAGIRLTK